MEYERERDISTADIAHKVGFERLIQGHQLTEAFFAELQAEPGSTELKPNIEWRDTPPPIVYDDEFGKAVLSFSRLKTGQTTMAVFEMKYEEEGKKAVYLLDYTKEGFFFAGSRGGFSIVSALGDPVIFFDYGLLTISRQFLFALEHEIGHSWQGNIERDLWNVVSSQASTELVKGMRRKYPHLGEYLSDLTLLSSIASEEDPNNKSQLARRVANKGRDGVNPRWLDPELPERVDDYLSRCSFATHPIGPSHHAGFFNYVRANVPALFDVFDPMGERMAWEFAEAFDDNGFITTGFHSLEERNQFMIRALESHDRRHGVENYTRWLKTRASY